MCHPKRSANAPRIAGLTHRPPANIVSAKPTASGTRRMRQRVVVGVDLGGTRIRLVAGRTAARSGRGDRGYRLEARAPSLADLPRFLQRLWGRWGLTKRAVAALAVAARGVWTVAERQAQEQRLRGLAERVRVISDAEAAFLGAVGECPGILMLAGTGAIVLGRDRRGRWVRAGGLGPLMGDEGSAFWIGRQWLRATPRRETLARRLARTPDAVARVAALAPSVLQQARRGHPAARAIVANAQELLAALAGRVARELRLPAPVRVSWAGSLLDNRAFRAGLWRALRRQGIRARVVAPREPPVLAAHSLARRLARDVAA